MRKTYKGQVFSGIGVAATRVNQNLEIYKRESGMNLVLGTLNVQLTEKFRVPTNSLYIPPERIKPIKKKRGVTLVPARIQGEEVIIMVPEQSIYEKNIIEIMAPFNIREKFCFKDGDEIEVVIDSNVH